MKHTEEDLIAQILLVKCLLGIKCNHHFRGYKDPQHRLYFIPQLWKFYLPQKLLMKIFSSITVTLISEKRASKHCEDC